MQVQVYEQAGESVVGFGGMGPRERLHLSGASALSDAELLAVLIGTGTRNEPVLVLASRVLQEAGGLPGLAKVESAQLHARAGIGPSKAARILAAIELGVRVQSRPFHPEQAISCSRDVEAALGPRLRDQVQEHFLALALDARHRPLAVHQVAVGGLSQCGFTPADAFRGALKLAAHAVIFVHNHPSGDIRPSEDDRQITRRLCRLGNLLGVQVLDHVIVGAGGYYSFQDAGLIPRLPLVIDLDTDLAESSALWDDSTP